MGRCCSRLAFAVALSFALPGKEKVIKRLHGHVYEFFIFLRWPCIMSKTKASKDPPFFCLLFLHLSLVEKFPVFSPIASRMGSVLASLFTYYRYPSKFWGTCCPPWGWSSRLDCPTITDFYRFPLMLLDPLPKAGLPPLTAGILSLCFLGSLLTYYCRCCGMIEVTAIQYLPPSLLYL